MILLLAASVQVALVCFAVVISASPLLRLSPVQRFGVALWTAGIFVWLAWFFGLFQPRGDVVGLAMEFVGLCLWRWPPDDWWRRRRRTLAATTVKVRKALARGIEAKRPVPT